MAADDVQQRLVTGRSGHPRLRRGARGQGGETLIETLISLVVLSMVAVAAFTGLGVSIVSSAQHRDAGAAEAALRSAAERLQDPTSAYLPLAGCDGRPGYDSDAPITAMATTGQPRVTAEVRFWQPFPLDGPTPIDVDFLAAGICPSTDPGLQLIELSVTDGVGGTERLDVLKRDNGVRSDDAAS